MPQLLKNLVRKNPDTPRGRVRNYLASRELGAISSTVHENIINPGATVPWHHHACEEILVIMEGRARCQTPGFSAIYEPGDVIIMPAGEEHTIENIGDVPMRQICFFPSLEVGTVWRVSEVSDGQSLNIANSSNLV